MEGCRGSGEGEGDAGKLDKLEKEGEGRDMVMEAGRGRLLEAAGGDGEGVVENWKEGDNPAEPVGEGPRGEGRFEVDMDLRWA